VVTVLFADLVGFTTLAQDRDPEAVRDLLSRYFDAASEIVTLHGGTIEKFIGDAVMAVWGTPTAHEDDAERAVRAGLELVDKVSTLHPGLEARAGILTGEAAVTLNATNQGMVAGDLVNTAARLQGVADPGTVLVGETTQRAAEHAVVFQSLGDHSLKGKTSPVPAWRAVRVVANRGGQGRSDALEPPFVGREEELRQLKEVLHAVGRERRPRLVSITGAAGIGKSRLAWELDKYVDGVAEPIYWHRGRSPSYGEGISFWALGEMVRRRAQLTEEDDEATTRDRIAATLEEYVPDASDRERIGPALTSLLGLDDAPAGGRDTLFPAWRAFFENVAEAGTTVLVFEDLQWADSGLLDFIDHLLEWSRALPIMVVTLARPELFDRRPDWGAAHRHMTALALEPLSDDEIRLLLEGMVPGLAPDALAAIVGRAEGMPLYAVEMVRGLLADGRLERQGDVYVPTGDLAELRVPESLRSLIASRLDGLDATDRSLMQDASVLGQVFTVDSLAAIAGMETDAVEARLRALVRREILDVERDPGSPERGQFKFVQSLIREVAYGTLGRRERRSRHLAVARHFEMIGDEELAGALASHYLAAHETSDPGPEADAIAAQARLALAGAASRAASLGTHEQAVAYLTQALSVTADPAERAELLERAAVSAAAAAVPEAVEFAEAAVAARRQTGDVEGALRASAIRGRVLLDAGEVAAARNVLQAAVDEAAATDAPPLAALLAQLSRVHMRAASYPAALDAADRALAMAEPADDEHVVAEALANRAASLAFLGRRREGASLMRLAIEIAEALGMTELDLRARGNLASIIFEDDMRRAMEVVMEAHALARERGDRSRYVWTLTSMAAGRIETGEDWDEQMELMRTELEKPLLRSDRVRLRTLLGAIQLARGDGADEVIADLEAIGDDPADPDEQFARLQIRALQALLRHDFVEAYRHAVEATDLPTQVPDVSLRIGMHAAIALRDVNRVGTLTARFDAIPLAGSSSRAARRHYAAALAALEGRTDEAVSGFLAAAAERRRVGIRFMVATGVVDAVTLLPDRPELRPLVAEARATFERSQARPWLERLDSLLPDGVPPPRGAALPTSSPEVASSAPTAAADPT
jgi:class 3 adenylate cyclase/predicted ATPase